MNFIVSLLVNTIAFIVIAELMPTFKIKTKGTAVVIAFIYGILLAFLKVFLFPIILGAAIMTLILGPLALIGIPLVIFVLTFAISVIALIITDKILDDFWMKDLSTAIIASILLGIINVVISLIIPTPV